MKHTVIVALRIVLVLAGLPLWFIGVAARIAVAFVIIGWRFGEELLLWILN